MCVAKPPVFRYHMRAGQSALEAIDALHRLTPRLRRNRTPEGLERRKNLAVSRRRGEVDRLTHVLSSLLGAVAPVSDVGQGREHGRAIVAARTRDIERLAE